jgi:hypothetical protein
MNAQGFAGALERRRCRAARQNALAMQRSGAVMTESWIVRPERLAISMSMQSASASKSICPDCPHPENPPRDRSMNDDLSQHPADECRVDVRNEADFWTGELGCSRAELRRAVAVAGHERSAVLEWLEATSR